MAKVTLTDEVLRQAIAAYTNGKDMGFSQREREGHMEWIIEPGSILVSQENGKLICPDQATYEALCMIIAMDDTEPAKPRQSEDRPRQGANVPARTKPANGHLAKAGMAVRDIQVAELTFDDIKTYICPTANDQEVMIFLKLCQARNLNPFLRDAYLIKYDQTKPAQMVVGKDSFTKKAEDHPKFAGYKAGIIVKTGDSMERREGCFWMEGENLVGGWAEVYRTDRKETPYKMEVPRKEYDTGKSNWVTKPATMIRKVALVQALREAFPSEFSGMYDSAEMGLDPEKEIVAGGKA